MQLRVLTDTEDEYNLLTQLQIAPEGISNLEFWGGLLGWVYEGQRYPVNHGELVQVRREVKYSYY